MDFGPLHRRRFSIDKARYLIESAGFEIASIADSGLYHYLDHRPREKNKGVQILIKPLE